MVSMVVAESGFDVGSRASVAVTRMVGSVAAVYDRGSMRRLLRWPDAVYSVGG
ncbi:hypothetical protein ACFQ3B_20815 [Stackebrandtia endophytica]|uniref:hypothetical protein n=1 Tax=Stackebrandtia endophytica TaxID=1496996 RepID=UPI001476A87D|nr:hypothetical protein [Stackebrandtia endophytica]